MYICRRFHVYRKHQIYWSCSQKDSFIVGTKNGAEFSYLGLNTQQYENHSISIDQISYINSIKCIEIDAKKKLQKEDQINDTNWTKHWGLIEQLGWEACQTRPHLYFHVCELRSATKKAKVLDVMNSLLCNVKMVQYTLKVLLQILQEF